MEASLALRQGPEAGDWDSVDSRPAHLSPESIEQYKARAGGALASVATESEVERHGEKSRRVPDDLTPGGMGV